MNEFDKEKLIEKDIKAVENRIRHAFNQGYEAGLKHGKEQEPLTDVLDKIRAEIEKAWFVDKDANASGLEVAMQIIDKYKGAEE